MSVGDKWSDTESPDENDARWSHKRDEVVDRFQQAVEKVGSR